MTRVGRTTSGQGWRIGVALAGLALGQPALAADPPMRSGVVKIGLILSLSGLGAGSITRGSPYFVRVSHSNWQMAYSLGIWAAKHGVASAHTLVADYAAGLDNKAAFKQGFTDTGGKFIGSDHTPLATNDYLPYMDRIKAASPQSLVVFTLAGPATIAAMKAFADAGLLAQGVQLLGTGHEVPDDDLQQIGPAELGMVNAPVYIASNQRPQNLAFVAAWRQAYGAESEPDFGGGSA